MEFRARVGNITTLMKRKIECKVVALRSISDRRRWRSKMVTCMVQVDGDGDGDGDTHLNFCKMKSPITFSMRKGRMRALTKNTANDGNCELNKTKDSSFSGRTPRMSFHRIRNGESAFIQSKHSMMDDCVFMEEVS